MQKKDEENPRQSFFGSQLAWTSYYTVFCRVVVATNNRTDRSIELVSFIILPSFYTRRVKTICTKSFCLLCDSWIDNKPHIVRADSISCIVSVSKKVTYLNRYEISLEVELIELICIRSLTWEVWAIVENLLPKNFTNTRTYEFVWSIARLFDFLSVLILHLLMKVKSCLKLSSSNRYWCIRRSCDKIWESSTCCHCMWSREESESLWSWRTRSLRCRNTESESEHLYHFLSVSDVISSDEVLSLRCKVCELCLNRIRCSLKCFRIASPLSEEEWWSELFTNFFLIDSLLRSEHKVTLSFDTSFSDILKSLSCTLWAKLLVWGEKSSVRILEHRHIDFVVFYKVVSVDCFGHESIEDWTPWPFKCEGIIENYEVCSSHRLYRLSWK